MANGFGRAKVSLALKWLLTSPVHLVIMPNMKMKNPGPTPEQLIMLAAKTDVLKALAHPTRLWMAEQLLAGERCVCTFVDGAGIDFSTVSKHLAILRRAGIVADEKRGKQVYYRLLTPCILEFMTCVEGVIASRVKSQMTLLQGSGKPLRKISGKLPKNKE
jgi:DNA-binding transcriptional ArsR family regulator